MCVYFICSLILTTRIFDDARVIWQNVGVIKKKITTKSNYFHIIKFSTNFLFLFKNMLRNIKNSYIFRITFLDRETKCWNFYSFLLYLKIKFILYFKNSVQEIHFSIFFIKNLLLKLPYFVHIPLMAKISLCIEFSQLLQY